MPVTHCPNCDHPIGRFNKGSYTGRIADLLESEGFLTIPEIATALHISEDATRKAVHRLSSDGLVRSQRIRSAVNGLAGARLKWGIV